MGNKNDDSTKEMLLNLRRLKQSRKGIEDRNRADSKGYSMEGMRLVALLNQLQALQAVQGLTELAPRQRNAPNRFQFSSSAEERDRQRQWLTFKADWLEALLEDTVEELGALNRFEKGDAGSEIEKRIFERKLIESPTLYEIAIISEDSRTLNCRVLDYSAGGLRLDLSERIDKGSPVRLRLADDAALDTTVMWSEKGEEACQAGVRVEDDPEEVYEELKKHFE